MAFKSGFVALIGRPNVGKSTLLNSLLGQKVAIVSPKAQTTRNVIRGVYSNSEIQIVFLDTPGLQQASNVLGKYMNQKAKASCYEVEAILLVADASKDHAEDYETLIRDIKDFNCPLFLVLNKFDLISTNQLLTLTASFAEKFTFAGIIPVSARKKDNLEQILVALKEVLPEGPKYYPESTLSDNPESFIVSEIIREKILSFTREEIPHSVAVIVEKMTTTSKALNIFATIIVERESQKGILIGKNGQMLRKIGTSARQELSRILATPIHLETFVRVEKDWRNSLRYLKEFGYRD